MDGLDSVGKGLIHRDIPIFHFIQLSSDSHTCNLRTSYSYKLIMMYADVHFIHIFVSLYLKNILYAQAIVPFQYSMCASSTADQRTPDVKDSNLI